MGIHTVYSYDGEGLHAGLTENGKRTTFLFHNGEILTECGGSGESAPIRRHIRGTGLSHVQTLNLYAYCANNSVMYYDPSGHACEGETTQAKQPDTPAGQVGDKSGTGI